jgi:hypothetical protein
MTDDTKTQQLPASMSAAGKPTAEKAHPEARVFQPNTRFQTMARRAGGVRRDRAIEQAAAAVEEAKVGFDDWLESELRTLMVLIGSVRAGEAKPDWADTALFHCAQLRDVGGTVSFELLTYVAGTLCTILEGIKSGAECNMESIACHIDALLLIRQKQYRNLRPDQVPELAQGLFRVAEQVSIVPSSDPKE